MECRHEFTMCRLCLCGSVSFIDIFHANELFGYVAAEVITDVLQFRVSETDGYPHVICSTCLGKLMDFKQFKEQCENSRDTYNNVFASDESHAEYPVHIEPLVSIKTEPEDGANDVYDNTEADLAPANSEEEETITDDVPPQVELRPVKLEPEDHWDAQDAQEDAQQEIGNCGIGLTSLERLPHLWKGARRESYGPYESNVTDNGKPLLKRRKMVAVDADSCENIDPSGSAEDKVEKANIEVGRDRVSQGDVNRVESSVTEWRRDGMDDANCVGSGVGATLEDGETFQLNLESYGKSERGEEEVPISGANERGGKMRSFRYSDCGKEFVAKGVPIRHLGVRGYFVNVKNSRDKGDSQRNADVGIGSKRNANDVVKTTGSKRKVKRDEEGVTKYVCDSCGKGFDWIGQMKIHLRVHTGEKPFSCRDCGKTFAVKSNLRRHNLTHTGEKRFGCEVCGKDFALKSHFVSHRRIHTGEKPYNCQVCRKKFRHSTSLTKHGRVHSGEKPYICEICGKKFSQSVPFTNHMLVHGGEKPYKCEMCGKKFAQSGTLTRHMQVHSGEKRYKCQICGKTFSQNATLTGHMRVHSGEKPYKCQRCDRCFSDSSNLKKHLRIHSQ